MKVEAKIPSRQQKIEILYRKQLPTAGRHEKKVILTEEFDDAGSSERSGGGHKQEKHDPWLLINCTLPTLDKSMSVTCDQTSHI